MGSDRPAGGGPPHDPHPGGRRFHPGSGSGHAAGSRPSGQADCTGRARGRGHGGDAAGGWIVRVLVVEDDPVVRELIEWKLAAAGHEALLAEDGEAGLNRARTDNPDAVIVDWMMPKLTGLEVCEAIR